MDMSEVTLSRDLVLKLIFVTWAASKEPARPGLQCVRLADGRAEASDGAVAVRVQDEALRGLPATLVDARQLRWALKLCLRHEGDQPGTLTAENGRVAVALPDGRTCWLKTLEPYFWPQNFDATWDGEYAASENAPVLALRPEYLALLGALRDLGCTAVEIRVPGRRRALRTGWGGLTVLVLPMIGGAICEDGLAESWGV